MTEKKTHTFESSGLAREKSLVLEASALRSRASAYLSVEQRGRRFPGVHLTGPQVADLIDALEPFAERVPAHVFDDDGDVWVEVEDGRFQIVGGEARRTLDEIDEFYSIDPDPKDEDDEEPLAAWERELLAKFSIGDRVRIVSDEIPGLKSATRAKIVAVVEDGYEIEDDGSNNALFRFAGTKVAPEDALRALAFQDQYPDQGYLPVKPEPAGDVTGTVVWVTGDSDEWGHGFEPGTAVEILDDDVVLDGSYEAKPVKGGASQYVGANDLAIESPLSQEIPNGTRVKILDNGADHDLRHYLEVGAYAVVEGWKDLSLETGSSYRESYTLRGPSDEFRMGSLVQSVVPASFEVSSPLAEYLEKIAEATKAETARLAALTYPRRFVTGVDPAVQTWEEILGKASAPALAPARVFEVPTPPVFEVGDRVRLIDGGGHHVGSVGDLGTVEDKKGEGISPRRGPLLKVRLDDGGVTERFASRFEKVDRVCACGQADCDLGPFRDR